jgi:hypothetical protein
LVINLKMAALLELVNPAGAAVLRKQDGFDAAIDREARYWWPILLTCVLFSVQQLCDGLVWVEEIDNGQHSTAAYFFSFFAFCFWPLWIPTMCFVLELRLLPSRKEAEVAVAAAAAAAAAAANPAAGSGPGGGSAGQGQVQGQVACCNRVR